MQLTASPIGTTTFSPNDTQHDNTHCNDIDAYDQCSLSQSSPLWHYVNISYVTIPNVTIPKLRNNPETKAGPPSPNLAGGAPAQRLG